MSELSSGDLDSLATVAAEAIRAAVVDDRCFAPDLNSCAPILREPRAVFVTLRKRSRLGHGGQLRGCVGTLTPDDPLVIATADRARAAALDDPRFDPVRPDEIDDLSVSVSVLSATQPLAAQSYHELLELVRPDVDGIVIEAGRHRATFLPAVWDDLASPAEFLGALWRKASLPARAWPPGMKISRYTASHSRELPLHR